MGLCFWSERATPEQLRQASTVMLRQELARLSDAVRQIGSKLRQYEEGVLNRDEEWERRTRSAFTHKDTAASRVMAELDRREPLDGELYRATRHLLALVGSVKWDVHKDGDILDAIKWVDGELVQHTGGKSIGR